MRLTSRILVVVCALAALAFAAAPAEADLNGKVNKLSRKVNKLTGRVDTLTGRVDTLQGQVDSQSTTLGCLRRVAMTSYDGYWYGYYGDYTTALDFTEPGSIVDVYVVKDTCGTIPLGRPIGDTAPKRPSMR